MYIRFVTPFRLRDGIDQGFFDEAYDLARGACADDSLRLAIRHELDWFDAELPAPAYRVFRVRSRKRWLAVGICWFRDDAREMIARAHGLAGLLRDCGVPIARLKTRHPGQILYRDDWQIVAKPEAETPTAWR
jgi:hypothetical protein